MLPVYVTSVCYQCMLPVIMLPVYVTSVCYQCMLPVYVTSNNVTSAVCTPGIYQRVKRECSKGDSGTEARTPYLVHQTKVRPRVTAPSAVVHRAMEVRDERTHVPGRVVLSGLARA